MHAERRLIIHVKRYLQGLGTRARATLNFDSYSKVNLRVGMHTGSRYCHSHIFLALSNFKRFWQINSKHSIFTAPPVTGKRHGNATTAAVINRENRSVSIHLHFGKHYPGTILTLKADRILAVAEVFESGRIHILVGALVEYSKLITVANARVFAFRIATTTTVRLHSNRAANYFFVLHR